MLHHLYGFDVSTAVIRTLNKYAFIWFVSCDTCALVLGLKIVFGTIPLNRLLMLAFIHVRVTSLKMGSTILICG